MVTKRRSWIAASLRLGLLAAVAAAVLAVGSTLRAQVVDGSVVEAVGGISINPKGVLDNVNLDEQGDMIRDRAKGALDKIPAVFGEAAELRKVSLRQLEAAVEEFKKTGKPLPQDVKFLGGLQRIRYVLVYPEQKDIVLVGPGEGWKVEPRRGNIVGVTTGRPVCCWTTCWSPCGPRRRPPKAASPARSIPTWNGPPGPKDTAHLPRGADPHAVAATPSRPSACRRSPSTACRRPAISPASWWPPITT